MLFYRLTLFLLSDLSEEGAFSVCTAGSGGNCQGTGRDCDSQCAGGSVCVGRDLGKHK